MMPNFLVIGAQRSGTTALYLFLRQHPDVFMPDRKEPHHFVADLVAALSGPGVPREAIRDRAAYEALFAPAARRRARGEASTWYLYLPEAPWRIHEAIPDARLLAVLRHPADRAFSAYLQLRRDGRERARDLAEALALEPDRIRRGMADGRYRDFGYYGAQLARYYDVFPRERLRVYLYEDLERDPAGVVRDAYAFLGVDPAFVPDVSAEANAGGVPRNPAAAALLGPRSPIRRIVRLLPVEARERLKERARRRMLVRPVFPPDVRARLTAEYAGDIGRLSALIGRDLSHWLAPAA